MHQTDSEIEARLLGGQPGTEFSKSLLRQNVDPPAVGTFDDRVATLANSYAPNLWEQKASGAKGRLPVEAFGIKAQIVRDSEKVAIDAKGDSDDPHQQKCPNGQRFISREQMEYREPDAQTEAPGPHKGKDAIKPAKTVDRHAGTTLIGGPRCGA
jgi:hypothetical protein